MSTAADPGRRDGERGQEPASGGPKVGPSGIPAAGRVLLVWTIASLISGAVGAAAAVVFGAPYYFGFFFGFVLVGLAGLFAVAAHISKYQNGGR